MVRSKQKTKYNSDRLRQWIHIAEECRLDVAEWRDDHAGVGVLAVHIPPHRLFHPFAEQRLYEHHYYQSELPPDYPQEQSDVQSQEVPV